MNVNSENIDISKYDGYIEIGFGNNWKYVTTIRTFIQNFINISIDDAANADKISLASSELVENAIKYSARDDVPTKFLLTLTYVNSNKQLTMEVRNCASEEDIETLQKEFAKIMTNTPYEAYLKKVEEIATRDDGKTMLGLARIRYETGCNMHLDIDKNMITIRAEFKI